MLAAGTTLGPYKVLAPLGAGGMGEVYRAHDPRLERDIALKVLPDSLTADATARARLIREARAAAALSHANICVVHDVGEAAGLVYIAMELVEGKSLSEGIGGKPLPVESVIRYGAQIAGALAHAHERHVIHRDLKSGNVMITADGRAKVLDLGLARRVWEVDENAPTRPQVTLTESGVVVGTPHYLAPEVLRGAKAEAVSDVWALGVVLYEMATGRLPFRGRTTYELSAAIVNETPPPLSERVPAGLRAVIAGCLAKQPGERSQTAREVRAALEALQGGATPVEAPVLDERIRPKPRRPRVATKLGFTVVLLAAAMAAWLTRESWLPRPRLREVQLTNQSWEMSVAGAAISPDGRMLLYDDWSGLHLTDPATKETHDIPLPAPLRGKFISYSWRPDSRSFVVGGRIRTGLWEISVLSAKAVQIRATGTRPTVSPDGQRIAFIDRGGVNEDSLQLWVMDAAGVGARKLGDVILNSWAMCWSPESDRIAVLEGAKKGLTIFDVQPVSRWRVLEDQRFTNNSWSVDAGIAWTEPRRLVVSLQDSTAQASAWDLYEVRLDARGTRMIDKPRRLTNWGNGNLNDFTLTSDHRKLAVLRGWFQSDVYWADLAPRGERVGELKRLTLENGDKFLAGWTPASDGVFYVSGSRSYRQLLESPTPELIDDRQQLGRTRWDGGKWLYRRRYLAGGVSQLTRNPVDGGATQVVKEWPPTAHSDSGARYVTFDIAPVAGVPGVLLEWLDSALVISRLDPSTGATSETMRLRGYPDYARGALSRDGGRLALSYGVGTIDLVDQRTKRVSTLRPRLTGEGITADSLFAQDVIWLPQDDGLLATTFSPGGLWRVELNGRATRVYANRDFKDPWVGSPQLSPDGRKIALMKFTTQTNAWLVEGLK